MHASDTTMACLALVQCRCTKSAPVHAASRGWQRRQWAPAAACACRFSSASCQPLRVSNQHVGSSTLTTPRKMQAQQLLPL